MKKQKIPIAIINGKNVVKKDFEIINENNVISFNFNNLTFAFNVNDLKVVIGGN